MLRYIYVLFSIGVLVCSQKVYEIIMYRNTFLIYTGNPRQELHATFSMELSNTIFLDNTCGVKPTNCGRYCNDVSFATIYCESICQFQYVAMNTMCDIVDHSDHDLYFLSYSKTFKLLNKNVWNSETWFTNLLSGQFFTDKLVFIDDSYDPRLELEIKSAVMIRGMMLDVSLYGTNGVMVGFGPGENNILVQLYAQNLIPSPIIMFNLNPMFEGLLKIGDYNDESCVNWTKHATQDQNRWVLEVQGLELNGVKYDRKLKALITNHVQFISLPSDFLNTLFEANVLKEFNKFERMIYHVDSYFDCRRPLKLQMTADDRELTIPNDVLLYDDPHPGNLCIAQFKRHDPVRYNFEVNMLLGRPFLKQFCIGFDYSNDMAIRLAEHSNDELSKPTKRSKTAR
ncbi:hypothetical protein M3Y95_01025200 [Aphelenchoides besseyi]|nr:hypothetical protein M3Y95_01025200 [Aphelenchoides besseyi]